MLPFLAILVLAPRVCNPTTHPMSYSRWLGGRGDTHSVSDTLLQQLSDYDIDYARLHPNMTTVFQSQLTETDADVESCFLGTLGKCPSWTSCSAHATRIKTKPALQYWEIDCQDNPTAISYWYNQRLANYSQLDNAVNVILLDFFPDAYQVSRQHMIPLVPLTLGKNLALAKGCQELPNPDRWMEQLSNCSAVELFPSELTLIGTHDAASYAVYPNAKQVKQVYSKKICQTSHWLCNLETSLSRGIISSFATTQRANFTETLSSGARYLDWRIIPVSRNSGNVLTTPTTVQTYTELDVYFTHNFVLFNLSFTEGLFQLRDFLNSHPKEVVLVYLSHIDSVYTADEISHIRPFLIQTLSLQVNKILGKWVVQNCNNDRNRLPSLQEIHQQQDGIGGVLFLFDLGQSLANPLFWSAIGAS